MKKFLAMLLAVVMIIAVATTAFADEGEKEGFTGKLKLSCPPVVAPGATVRVTANVSGNNMSYSISWSRLVGGSWEAIPNATKDGCNFVMGSSGHYEIRATLTAADGTTLTKIARCDVEKPEEKKPEEEKPADKPAEPKPEGEKSEEKPAEQ